MKEGERGGERERKRAEERERNREITVEFMKHGFPLGDTIESIVLQSLAVMLCREPSPKAPSLPRLEENDQSMG